MNEQALESSWSKSVLFSNFFSFLPPIHRHYKPTILEWNQLFPSESFSIVSRWNERRKTNIQRMLQWCRESWKAHTPLPLSDCIPTAVYLRKSSRVNIQPTYIYRSHMQPGAGTSRLFGCGHSSAGHVNSRTWWTRLSIVTWCLSPEQVPSIGATLEVIAGGIWV